MLLAFPALPRAHRSLPHVSELSPRGLPRLVRLTPSQKNKRATTSLAEATEVELLAELGLRR